MTAASRLTRGVVALGALGLLVIGVPVFLALVVGWPLPHGTITVSGVTDALDGTTPIPDAFWFGALACLAWFMWLRVTIAVLAETQAAIAGRPVSDHGVRRVMGSLVAAALLTIASTRPIRPAAAEPVRPLPAAAPVAAASPTPQATPAAAAAPTWTVARNDTLWEIAERTLGDPLRWHDIYGLNEGRPQPDGGALVDPSLLRPGWTLQLPTDATTAPDHGGAVTVEPGDTLSGIAQRTLGDADRYPDLFTANAGVIQPDGDSLQDPNLIRPGWHIEIPAADVAPARERSPIGVHPDEPIPVPLPVVAPPTVPAAVGISSPTSPTSRPPSNDSVNHPSEDHQDESALILAGVLSGGIVTAISAARMRMRRRRKPGDTVPAASDAAAGLETRARRGAALHPAAPVASSLADLSSTLPTDVQLDVLSVAASGELEVLLSEPISKAPSGWQRDATGRLLTAECAEPGDVALSLPWLLCTLGTTGGREVLIDLARPALTRIRGSRGQEVALFRALMLALATSPLGECTDIIYVGRPRAPELETIRAFTGSDVVERLSSIAHANRETAAMQTPSSSRSVIFLDARFVDDTTTNEVAALAQPGLPVVIVGDTARSADRTLTMEDGLISVHPAGLVVNAPATADEVNGLWSLSETGAPDIDLPAPGTDFIADQRAPDATTHEEVPEVVVRLLGSVRVEGSADRFSRRIAEEVVAYLVLHRRGVDEGRLKSALWPERSPATNTFNQAVSRARIALGTNRSGEHHLPHLEPDGCYRVAGSVTSDVEILEAHLKAANLDPNKDTMTAIADCLDLVDGLPFAGATAGYEWAYAEGLVGWAQALVSDAAHVVASSAIEHRDVALALRATRSALTACPADEILYRDQMLAHDLAGNRAGVEVAMRELLAVIEAEVPQDAVHPETLALYERLCPRTRDGANAPVR